MKVVIETEMFRRMIRAISLNGLINTPRISFKKERLEATNIDISNISFSACHFGKDAFLEYEVSKEEDIGIEAGEVMKLIKHLSGDEITMTTDENSLVIVTDHEKLKIPTIETKEQKVPSLIEVGEDGVMSIQTGTTFYMDETIPVLKKELEGMGEDETTFEMKEEKLSVMQETTDGYLFQSVIMESVKSENFNIVFNTDYLKSVFNSLIDDEVQIRLGDKLPIILENKTDIYQVIFLLMSKIKND